MTHTHRRRRAFGLASALLLFITVLGVYAARPAGAVVVNPGTWNFQAQGGSITFANKGNAVGTPVAPAECGDGINNDTYLDNPTGGQQDTNIDYVQGGANRDNQCVGKQDNSESQGPRWDSANMTPCNVDTCTGTAMTGTTSGLPNTQQKSSIQVTADINAAGTMSNINLAFPNVYGVTSSGQTQILITQKASPAPTGSVDTATGRVQMTVTLLFTLKVASIVPLTCTGDLNLNLDTNPRSGTAVPPDGSTANPIAVTPAPYNPATGEATLADNQFTIPALSGTLCGPVNTGFGLPATAGQSAVQLTMKALPVANTAPSLSGLVDATSVSGQTVTLHGDQATDADQVPCFVGPCATPKPKFYKWTRTGGTAPAVTLADPTLQNPTYTATGTPGQTQIFQLQVNDGTGAPMASNVLTQNNWQTAKTITITNVAPNVPPTANAGGDQTVGSGSPVTLTGAASNDPDNGPTTPLAYSWTQTGGPAVSLTGATTVSPTFTAPTGPATLTFDLTVSDGAATSAADSVTINVSAPPNVPPTANAGGDQTVNGNAVVNLDGTGSSDPDNGPTSPLTYSWSQTGGTTVSLTGASTATPSFTAPVLGVTEDLTFQLTVGDGAATAQDTVKITVNGAAANVPPTANAGSDTSANGGTSIGLSSAGSNDGGDGPSALTYAWTQTAGPAATITNPTAANPTVNLPILGCPQDRVLTFKLTVNDGADSASDTVNVTLNIPDYPLTAGNYQNLDGKAEQGLLNPANGGWQVQCLGSFFVPQVGGIPVAGEWQTAGTTNAAVYNPGTGVWRYYIGAFQTQSFTFAGQPGDIPVPAKYNGSTTSVAAFYRPSTNQWIINGQSPITFGATDAIPVPGDYDGNGSVDLAYYTPSAGKWYVANGLNAASYTVTVQGGPGFIPVPGNYVGGAGIEKMVVKNGVWYLQGSGIVWSTSATDIPAVGDYDGTGNQQIGVFRTSTQQFIWRPYNSTGFSKIRAVPGIDGTWRPTNTPWAITRLWG